MANIEFFQDRRHLVLEYTPENGIDWVHEKLAEDRGVSLRNTFHFKEGDVYERQDDEFDGDSILFKVARKSGDYYKFKKSVLGIGFDLFIHKTIKLDYRSFTAEKNVSIFSRVDKFGLKTLYVGGDEEGCLPEDAFYELIKNFPNTHELRLYVFSRVNAVLRNYLEIEEDSEGKYRKYMNRKPSRIGENARESFREYEAYKFKAVHSKIQNMLNDENSYNEVQWQKEILEIILLLYPKYIQVFKSVPVKDTYNDKWRQLDFMLVDATGNVDIVEIKQPFSESIVSKNQYRDNHIPLRELSGSIMQIEKYLFYLNKWGRKGEEYLSEKYKSNLPSGLDIKITNPSGLVIMGRENGLSQKQKQDFEVIKRKYKNVIDIISYDDLVRRLGFIIDQFGKTIVVGD